MEGFLNRGTNIDSKFQVSLKKKPGKLKHLGFIFDK
jgi:hypothetical protein